MLAVQPATSHSSLACRRVAGDRAPRSPLSGKRARRAGRPAQSSALASCFSPEFVARGRDLILAGRSGRGKKDSAIAIAYKAIQHGFDARSATAVALIDDLSSASREGRFRAAVQTSFRPTVLVCDEFGYLVDGPDAANVLCHVVNACCIKRRSLLPTADKPLRDWGAALCDHDLAEAIIDRRRVVALEGPSMRTRHLEGIDHER